MERQQVAAAAAGTAGAGRKNAKKLATQQRKDDPPSNCISVSGTGVGDVGRGGTRRLHTSKKNLYLCNRFNYKKKDMSHYGMGMKPSQEGYTIKDGRLINMAPSPEMGITKLADMRRGLKRAKKVRMIAEGNELAKANIDLFKKL